MARLTLLWLGLVGLILTGLSFAFIIFAQHIHLILFTPSAKFSPMADDSSESFGLLACIFYGLSAV